MPWHVQKLSQLLLRYLADISSAIASKYPQVRIRGVDVPCLQYISNKKNEGDEGKLRGQARTSY